MQRKVIATASLAIVVFLGNVRDRTRADGDEILGPPTSGFTITAGTGIIAKGVGLFSGQPGYLNILVPTNANVKQVLLYWNGFVSSLNNDPGSIDTILVNDQPTPGIRVGGPENLDLDFGFRFSSTYRRDITSSNLVAAGQSTLKIAGLGHFDLGMTGAALVVIFDDFSQAASVPQIRDGQDYAFINNPEPVQTRAEPQTFSFPASTSPRIAQLTLLFGDGSDRALVNRASVIDISINGVLAQRLINALASDDGGNWDTLNVEVAVPPGATSVTVLPQSANVSPDTVGELPASFIWVAAGFNLRNSAPLKRKGQLISN
jgi:hypothetical protein